MNGDLLPPQFAIRKQLRSSHLAASLCMEEEWDSPSLLNNSRCCVLDELLHWAAEGKDQAVCGVAMTQIHPATF